jgi:hypothetical protein
VSIILFAFLFSLNLFNDICFGINSFISAIFTMILACWVIILYRTSFVKNLRACLVKFLKRVFGSGF